MKVCPQGRCLVSLFTHEIEASCHRWFLVSSRCVCVEGGGQTAGGVQCASGGRFCAEALMKALHQHSNFSFDPFTCLWSLLSFNTNNDPIISYSILNTG